MSAIQIYVLVCNHPGCTARFQCDSARASHTRSEASRLFAWVHHVVQFERNGPSPSVDLCGEHRDANPYDCLPPKPCDECGKIAVYNTDHESFCGKAP